jgi:UDP-N-acetylglucosamine--N-acetylmuramyl-(pentapeptide) pyrophosphoryl-undecaprenol N-acetylglucosamine transferase
LNREIRIILAGGGTGGHVFPAIYIARYLKKYWGARCQFIGTSRGIESIKVPQAGFVLKKIWISGFKRGLHLSNLLFPLKLLVSMYQSKREIKYFKPDLVIGTGGYVSGPVLYQAVKMNIPTAIQEQNSYPGITTRILSGKVDHVFLAYEESLKYIKNIPQHSIVGNPVQIDFESVIPEDARKFFNLKKNITTILVFGGSQGASNINQAIDRLLLQKVFANVQIIWQTGPAHINAIQEKYKDFNDINLCILPFIDRMDYAYSISDFAICRSGAMTISELAAAGLPAILIPLPHAAANHQFKNASTVAKNGGALVVEDKTGMDTMLARAVKRMCESAELRKDMSEKISEFYQQDALDKIAAELKILYEKNKQ